MMYFLIQSYSNVDMQNEDFGIEILCNIQYKIIRATAGTPGDKESPNCFTWLYGRPFKK